MPEVQSAQVRALQVDALEPQLALVSVAGAGPGAYQHVHHVPPGQWPLISRQYIVQAGYYLHRMYLGKMQVFVIVSSLGMIESMPKYLASSRTPSGLTLGSMMRLPVLR